MSLTGFPFRCDLGRIIDDKELLKSINLPSPEGVRSGRKVFHLSDEQWSTHVVVIGPTGTGKSRTMWQMLREHRRQRRGFAVFDTGDLANDFLADCAKEIILTGNYGLLKKLHHVQLNPYHLPRYNLWGNAPPVKHPELSDFAMQCWRHTRVQSRLQIFQAKATGSTDFTVQVRAHRVMTNVFTAVATAIGGKMLAVEDAFLFFNPSHKYWRRAVDRVAPLLPQEVLQDIEVLGGFQRLDDIRKECESSISRLRSTLGPCLKAMLSATGSDPTLDLKSIIQRGDYLIVDVPQADWASHDENVALASMLALDLAETALNTKREDRKRFSVFIDETPELMAPLGREIGRWLRIMRKYGLTYILSFQDLSSMRRDDYDLAPIVLSQCGTIICFRNRWPDDTDLLARILLTGNLEFVPLVQEVERHAGERWLRIDEITETLSGSKSRSTTAATSVTETATRTETATDSEQTNFSAGKAEPISRLGAPSTPGTKTTVAGGGAGHSAGTALANGKAIANSHSSTEGETEGWSISVGHKLVSLPVIVRELQRTGNMEKAVSDQQEKNRQRLHGLDKQHVIVLAPGMKKAVEVETAEVKDPFASPSAQAKAVEWIDRELIATHPYFFTPDLSLHAQEQRLLEFLGEGHSADSLMSDEANGHDRNGNGTATAPTTEPRKRSTKKNAFGN